MKGVAGGRWTDLWLGARDFALQVRLAIAVLDDVVGDQPHADLLKEADAGPLDWLLLEQRIVKLACCRHLVAPLGNLGGQTALVVEAAYVILDQLPPHLLKCEATLLLLGLHEREHRLLRHHRTKELAQTIGRREAAASALRQCVEERCA
eukprot:5918544-Prymnesium_polylepis.2